MSTSLESIPCILYVVRSSISQESNALNGVPIRVEMKKLWPFEDNCIKLCEISQLRNELRNEIHLKNFVRCFAAAKPPASTRVPLCKLKHHLRNCEPHCKIKVQTCKTDNSMCEIHLCNLRYLLPT